MRVRKNISLWFLSPSIQSTSLAVLATRAASRHQGRKGAVRNGVDFPICHDLEGVGRLARAAGRRGELGAQWNFPAGFIFCRLSET